MKLKYLLSLFVVIVGLSYSEAFAQRNVTPAIDRDPVLEADAKHNLEVARQVMSDHSYRAPWRTDAEMEQFRSEITDALAARPHGFALSRAVVPLAHARHLPI